MTRLLIALLALPLAACGIPDDRYEVVRECTGGAQKAYLVRDTYREDKPLGISALPGYGIAYYLAKDADLEAMCPSKKEEK